MFLIGFMVLRLKCWTISEPCMRERVTKNSICKLIHWPEQYVGGSGVEKIKPLTHQIQKYLSDRVQFPGFLCRSTPGLNNQLYPSSVRSLRFSSDNSWHLLLSSFLSVSWSFYRPSDKLLGTEHSHLLSPLWTSQSHVHSLCANDKPVKRGGVYKTGDSYLWFEGVCVSNLSSTSRGGLSWKKSCHLSNLIRSILGAIRFW